MRTVATIEARMKSTRLPGKVMRPILGFPMLRQMIERLRGCDVLDDIVIATTEDPSCDVIEALALSMGVGCYRGSEEDVLGRVLRTAENAKADVIVKLTGDCPLLDPAIVKQVVNAFRSSGVDYCTNTMVEPYPRGMDVEVFPLSVLRETDPLASSPPEREHASLYIYRHPQRFSLLNVEYDGPKGANGLRLTVDTAEDFALVSAVFEALQSRDPFFSLADIWAFLSEHPEIRDLNAHVKQKVVPP